MNNHKADGREALRAAAPTRGDPPGLHASCGFRELRGVGNEEFGLERTPLAIASVIV
jgi:hypothetical protein